MGTKFERYFSQNSKSNKYLISMTTTLQPNGKDGIRNVEVKAGGSLRALQSTTAPWTSASSSAEPEQDSLSRWPNSTAMFSSQTITFISSICCHSDRVYIISRHPRRFSIPSFITSSVHTSPRRLSSHTSSGRHPILAGRRDWRFTALGKAGQCYHQ